MRDLDLVLVDRDEPVRGQGFEDERGVGYVVQLGAADAAFGVLGGVADRGQPDEQRPGQFLLPVGQPGEGRLGSAGQGALEPARGPEALQRQGVALAAVPGLQQRVGEQRQSARVLGAVRDELGHQGGFDGVAGRARGLDDGGTQLVGGHRADGDLRGAHGVDQRGEVRAVAVEVGPYAQHDAMLGDLLDEPATNLAVLTEREDLLELVDDEHGVGGRGDRGALVERALARREEHRAAAQPWHETGSEQRRLARTRRADDQDDAVAGDLLLELGDQLGAAEEPVGVLLLERGEARVGRGGVRFRLGLVGGRGVPAAFPLLLRATARAHVGERDLQRRQLAPARGLGQRGLRVVRHGAQLAVGGPARPLPQRPEFAREREHRCVARVERAFLAWHRFVPPVNRRAGRM